MHQPGPRRLSTHLAATASCFAVLAVSAYTGALIQDGPAGADTASVRHRDVAAAAADGTAVDTAPSASARPTASASPAASTPAAASPGRAVPVSTLAADGIPTTALRAYRRAARLADDRYASCGIVWPMVAAIGRVESDHGRFGGAVLHVDGVSTPGIVGVPLDGAGTEVVRDTDHGTLDGDTVYDRAIGPMQFIPSTWRTQGVDADGDGRRDPNDIDDAAAATAMYLCSVGADLRTYAGQRRAVLTYNHSDEYLRTVLGLERVYARGVVTVPTAPGHGDARITPATHPKPAAPSTPTTAPVARTSAPTPQPSTTRPRPTCTPTPTTSRTKSPSASASKSPSAGATKSPSPTASKSATPAPSKTPPTSPSKSPTRTATPTPPAGCR